MRHRGRGRPSGHAEYHHELAPTEVSLEILDISYIPTGLNPYGPGKGSIKTSGYLLPVKVNHSISLANEPVLTEEVYLATTISLSLDSLRQQQRVMLPAYLGTTVFLSTYIIVYLLMLSFTTEMSVLS